MWRLQRSIRRVTISETPCRESIHHKSNWGASNRTEIFQSSNICSLGWVYALSTSYYYTGWRPQMRSSIWESKRKYLEKIFSWCVSASQHHNSKLLSRKQSFPKQSYSFLNITPLFNWKNLYRIKRIHKIVLENC